MFKPPIKPPTSKKRSRNELDEEPANESMQSETTNLKSKGVKINVKSECIFFYEKGPPSEMKKVVFKVKTNGLTNNMDYAGNDTNTSTFPFGNYKLFGKDLIMTADQIEKKRKEFGKTEKFQQQVKDLGKNFYYPLICIRDWWNKQFRSNNGVDIILRKIEIEDIDIVEDISENPDNSFNAVFNINGVSEDGQQTIPVKIEVKFINNTGDLNVDINESDISSGGSKRRKLTKRRKILKKRKISKRRRKTRKY